MDINHLHHREGIERMLAQSALNSNAREAHLAMADAYRAQIARERRTAEHESNRARR